MKKNVQNNQDQQEENDNPPQTKKKPAPRKRKPAATKRATEPPKQGSHPPPETKPTRESKPKTLYRVKFFYEWCKTCGICSAMCPKKIIMIDEQGHPYIEDEDSCIGCRNCEIHCPDFAITVSKRYPERRKTNGPR